MVSLSLCGGAGSFIVLQTNIALGPLWLARRAYHMRLVCTNLQRGDLFCIIESELAIVIYIAWASSSHDCRVGDVKFFF